MGGSWEDRGRITGGSREDHGRIAGTAAGYSEMGYNLVLYLSCLWFMVRFSTGFQQNDGHTLSSKVLMSDKAKTYFIFPC